VPYRQAMSTTADPSVVTPVPPVAVAASDDEVRAARRSSAVAMCVFSTWVVVGLYLDGWAHNEDKPESFFTPWHGLLYSGFLAGVVWASFSDRRLRRRGIALPVDRLGLIGFGAFAAGGVADMAWHQVFGIEKDVAALLSPSHLLLMAAGLLLVTEPIRVVLDVDRDAIARGEPLHWRTFAPVAVGLTLTVAVLSFFGQFASGFQVDDLLLDSDGWELAQAYGVVSILLSTVLVVGAVVWATGPFPRPPRGTFALVFGANGVLMAGLGGFEQAAIVVPIALAGVLADLLVARGLPIRAVAAAVPAALWAGWFVTLQLVWGVSWPAEMSSGAVALSALLGYGLALLATTPRPARIA
jgi:hypothetical protein